MSKLESDRLASLLRLNAAEPLDGFVLYGLAQECQKLGRFSEALEWYDRTITADPAQCYAYFHKAKTLEAANRASEAPAVLRAGLARARELKDHKAANELEAYLDDFE